MLPRQTIADSVAAAGLCLLALAAIDGAIKLFQHFTAINLWMTCGLIGGLLLLLHVAIGALDADSSVRRGVRRLTIWNRLRLRRRAATQRDTSLGDSTNLSTAR